MPWMNHSYFSTLSNQLQTYANRIPTSVSWLSHFLKASWFLQNTDEGSFFLQAQAEAGYQRYVAFQQSLQGLLRLPLNTSIVPPVLRRTLLQQQTPLAKNIISPVFYHQQLK